MHNEVQIEKVTQQSPGNDDYKQRDAENISVSELLQNEGLPQYIQLFEEQGFGNDVSALLEVEV